MGLNLLGTTASASSYIPTSFSVNGVACMVQTTSTTRSTTLAAPIAVDVGTAGVQTAADGALKMAISDASRWLSPAGLTSSGLRLKRIVSATRSNNLVPGGVTRFNLVIMISGNKLFNKEQLVAVTVDVLCSLEGCKGKGKDVVKLRTLGLLAQ